MRCRSKEIGLCGSYYGLALSTSLLIVYLKGTTSWASKIKTAEGGIPYTVQVQKYEVFATICGTRSFEGRNINREHQSTKILVVQFYVLNIRARKIFSIVTVLYSTQKCSRSQTPPISSSFCNHVMMVNGTLPSCRVYGAVFQGSTIVILYE